MSLKAFHVVFITASIALAFGFSAWEIKSYSEVGRFGDLIYGTVSGMVGVALLVYGRYFLKKLKHISYL